MILNTAYGLHCVNNRLNLFSIKTLFQKYVLLFKRFPHHYLH